MVKYSVQIATKQTRSSGTAQPASTPSSQRSNGRRHSGGARSDRSAIAWNAKSIGTRLKSQEGKLCARTSPSISDWKQIAMFGSRPAKDNGAADDSGAA